jgi:hypothetical protein
MSVFFLDLWHDLREKGLWPVAVALALAVLAVPIVLAKHGSSSDGTPAPVPAAGGGPAGPAVQLDPDAARKGSKFDAFHSKNPFKGQKAPGSQQAPGVSAAKVKPTSAGKSGAGSSTAGAKAAPGAGGAGGGSTPTASPQPGASKRATKYTYTADVSVGPSGRYRTVRGLRRLDVLPRTGSGSIAFLGVTAPTHTAAKFLVDSSFHPSGGAGGCRPSRSRCVYLTLRLDHVHDVEYLTAGDGTRYRLRLLDIDRVPVKKRSR